MIVVVVAMVCMVMLAYLPKKDSATSDYGTDQKTGNCIQSWIDVHVTSVSGGMVNHKLYHFVLYCVIADNACDEQK
jgi:hypothetical protein